VPISLLGSYIAFTVVRQKLERDGVDGLYGNGLVMVNFKRNIFVEIFLHECTRFWQDVPPELHPTVRRATLVGTSVDPLRLIGEEFPEYAH